jgi:hypothetical protein
MPKGGTLKSRLSRRQLEVLDQLPFSLNIALRGSGLGGLRNTLASLWHLGLAESPLSTGKTSRLIETWHRTSLGEKELARMRARVGSGRVK